LVIVNISITVEDALCDHVGPDQNEHINRMITVTIDFILKLDVRIVITLSDFFYNKN